MGRSVTGKNKYPKTRKPGAGAKKKWHTKEERDQARLLALVKYRNKDNGIPYYRQHRNKYLKRQYNISLDDYDRMWNEQQGYCAICGGVETLLSNGKTKALSVDHNHKTGRVRQLLCYRCNVMLGSALESEDILMKAISYLREHHG